MFYQLMKLYGRFAIRLYCTKLIVNKPELLKENGPVLFAANHPNSFLDGVILTTIHKHDVSSLARGDVFKKSSVNKFLRYMKLLPVYRTSEGVENLEHNYTTFASCLEAFEEGHTVLIFSEGRCENEWHLRPLKKGTARLAHAAWQKGIPLKVIPLGINYSAFFSFGKEVHLLFGTPITSEIITEENSEGKKHLDFNEQLNAQLKNLVYEIDEKDGAKRKRIFSIRIKPTFYFLALPALAGFIIHAPFYFLMKLITQAKFTNSGHYDSVLVSLLFFGYPFYIAIITILLVMVFGTPGLLFIILLPLLAWCTTQAKFQLDI